MPQRTPGQFRKLDAVAVLTGPLLPAPPCIGAEHLLLSLLAEGDGIAAQVLAGRGAGYAQVRERVLALLTGRYEQADPKTRLVRLPVPAGLADATEQLRQVQRRDTAGPV